MSPNKVPVDFCVIIPARYASTRLPRKMLANVHGKPLIQHTYERAKASGATRVIIATDHEEIQSVCQSFKAEVCMTAAEHATGTDRIAEAARLFNLPAEQIIVNLQGDEPSMPPAFIRKLAEVLAANQRSDMATVCVPIASLAELFNPNIVKAVLDKQHYALYFSRAPIPWHRESFSQAPQTLPAPNCYWRHMGLYAFRQQFLQQLVSWQAAPIENIELLEQLRALYYGARIQVTVIEQQPPQGIDTLEDLENLLVAQSSLNPSLTSTT